MAEGSQRQWSSRSVGAAWQHRFFYVLIRVGGRQLAYLILNFVVFYYTFIRLDLRDRSAPYLKRRFPDSRFPSQLVRAYLMNLTLGKVLIDRAVVGILGPESMQVSLEGRQVLNDLVSEGRGVILLTAHVGCWQVAMSGLGYLNKPVNLLMHREDGDVDRLYFEHAGLPSPYRIIDPRGFLGGTIEMLKALKSQEVLSIMGDRVLGSDRNRLAVPFLGDLAYFPFSAFKLASVSGAPIAVLLSAKTKSNQYVLKLEKVIRVLEIPGAKGEVFEPYVGEYVEVLEGFTKKYPYQFFNFFDVWKYQEEGEVSYNNQPGTTKEPA